MLSPRHALSSLRAKNRDRSLSVDVCCKQREVVSPNILATPRKRENTENGLRNGFPPLDTRAGASKSISQRLSYSTGPYYVLSHR